MPDVRIDVYADTHGTPKNLKDVETSLSGVEKGVALADKAFGGLTKKFVSGQLIVQGLNKTYAILKDLVFDSIKGAIEQEKADNALTAALEITGRTVQGNLKHYLNFAGAQQKVTKYTDEEIEASQALLLTFGRLNQEGVDKATKAAMGLATVMNIDLQSATKLVEKAMIGEYGALSRAGIKIDENLTTGKKWASFLEQSEKLYQRSTKEIDIFGGEVDQLKKAFGEALETTGKVITGSDTLKTSLVLLKGAIEDLNTIASARGGNFIDILADKIPIIGNLTSTLDLLSMALHLEAAKVTYNENVYNGLTIALKTYDKILMNLGIDVEKITNGWIKHAKAVDEVGKALPPLVGKLKETIVPMDRAKLASTALELALYKLGIMGLRSGVQLGDSFVPVSRNLERLAVIAANVGLKLGETFVPAARNLDKLAAKMGHISPEWIKHLEEMKRKTKETMNKIFGAISGVMSQIDGIYQQSTNNRMLALDKEYQKRLDMIKNSVMSEEEKNKAIEGLDAEYNMKRREVQRKAAQEGKLVAIFNAIINVAEGMTKALAQGGIFGPILAAVVAAFGAVQIALIKAQPIPLAAGAIFQKPVFSQGYVAGEGGPEAVIPLSELPRLMRELGGGRGRSQAERPIIIRNQIVIDSREMKSFTTKTVRESGRLGFLGKVGKEMA